MKPIQHLLAHIFRHAEREHKIFVVYQIQAINSSNAAVTVLPQI